jgi:hypothetical protein
MAALLADDVRPSGDPDAVAAGRVVCERAGVIAGVALVVQVFGRVGVRCRPRVDDGDALDQGDTVAAVGGPAAAIDAAAPTAVRLLTRLSAIASGVADPEPGDPIEAHAASMRLSASDRVGDDGPSFRLDREEGGR